ncbi:MAG TPA: YifB family Mg chelatase-like AAA ATPase [Thermomicrobiales bacterium]|nr:YifB family Mg chelatase-like AAA ATPase [Thermomicrobiales bacterium]
MLARVYSCATVGLDGLLVEVEVDAGGGQPGLFIVGLPDAAIQEAKERVRAAIRNAGARFPHGHITVNLAPADVRKEGPAYDLPIALGILLASQQVDAGDALDGAILVGELGLDGAVRHINGVLSMVSLARERGLRRAFVPADDAREATLVGGVEILPIATLADLLAHLDGTRPIRPHRADEAPFDGEDEYDGVDLMHVKGQEQVKRGLEVAAAGGHNALMTGPPGSGKTLLARALPSILPRLTFAEALDVTRVYSVSGLLPASTPLIRHRPFRAPHHTVSQAGLVGGGRWPRPGEISLAHRGVLFLDELPEFGQQTLEVLRQPLEDKVVTISRASGTLSFPANIMLIGAMNPCPCGYAGDPVRECTCSAHAIARYARRISGPLLDRIDIHLDVPRIPYEKLSDDRLGEPSRVVRARVEAARAVQAARFAGTNVVVNAEMGPAEVRAHCALDAAGEGLMRAAMRQLHLSARAYHRVLKLARTIADLAGEAAIGAAHLAEALQYRPKEGT